MEFVSFHTAVKINNNGKVHQARAAQRGSRGMLYSCFNLGARWGGLLTLRPARFTPGKESPLLIVWDVGWASRSVWTVAENFETRPLPGFDSWTSPF